MKTVMNVMTEELKRMADEKAFEMVKEGWSFSPKNEWKTKVRDKNKIKSAKESKGAEGSERPEKGEQKREKKKSGWKKSRYQEKQEKKSVNT